MTDILAMANAAAATGPNMTEAQRGGGGEYTPPAAGVALCRLVGYVELGQHTREIPGKPPKEENQVRLVFELHGPKHEPKKLDDGTLLPHRLSIDTNLSLNEKANFFKLFQRMNYEGKATHMSQLLGQPFLCTVVHVKSKDGTKTFASLKDDSGYTIRPPRQEDALTGETKVIPVPPAISPLRLFIWNATPEFIGKMWDSLFIDGEYEPGRTKNVLQDQIKKANNFVNSPIFQHLQTSGVQMELGAAGNGASGATAASTPTPTTAQPAASDDPLANV